jgi:uncharacterized membrane protein YcaP (DUF421 family)
MDPLLFDNWPSVFRTLVIGVMGYVGIVFLLRISGKRTLSKMNMFDFLITVAFGSALASMLLSKDVTLAQGLMAFVVLVGLQFVVTWLSVRSDRFQSILKAEPRLLFHDGDYLRSAMKNERVSREELQAAMRQQGFASRSDVAAMVLETDGSISVIGREQAGKIDLIPGVLEKDNAVHEKDRR